MRGGTDGVGLNDMDSTVILTKSVHNGSTCRLWICFGNQSPTSLTSLIRVLLCFGSCVCMQSPTHSFTYETALPCGLSHAPLMSVCYHFTTATASCTSTSTVGAPFTKWWWCMSDEADQPDQPDQQCDLALRLRLSLSRHNALRRRGQILQRAGRARHERVGQQLLQKRGHPRSEQHLVPPRLGLSAGRRGRARALHRGAVAILVLRVFRFAADPNHALMEMLPYHI